LTQGLAQGLALVSKELAQTLPRPAFESLVAGVAVDAKALPLALA
tara:strand:- start:428 stop:562 length:135 start_codon:yes stop_codon:yes gene_type:complete